MTNLDTLRGWYSDCFTGGTPRSRRPLDYADREAFIVTSADTLHQDTIGDSNVATVSEHLGAEVIERRYTNEVVVWVDDMEADDDLAGEVLEVMEALEHYPVFDDSHYCDLEQQRLAEYFREDLPGEIAYYLEGVTEEEVSEWLREIDDSAWWDYNDGSVDDYPFDAEGLAEKYKRHNA